MVGSGLALAAAAGTTGFGAYAQTVRRRPGARPIDALLVDESIEMPSQMARFIEARGRTLPVVGIHLDAVTLGRLTKVLDQSHAIVGISSGATLFCLERIAWDHGYRLTGRTERCADDLGDHACRQDVASFLNAAYTPAVGPSPLARVYRPSRADGTLHAWAMEKNDGPRFRQGRQEV
ncbi:hypothetical protein WSK_4194 [Novosphingobium sp. Rr 2-17]|nr:hypothetical protein WSK_4194 [Novosphingobium sp. Rr 2-17]